jgi:hypothetical protein
VNSDSRMVSPGPITVRVAKGLFADIDLGSRVYSMVEQQPSKLMTTVRFALTRSINSPSVAGLKLMAKELQQ